MKTTVSQVDLASASRMIRPLLAKDGLSLFAYVRLDVAGSNVSLAGGNENMQLTCRFAGETKADGMAMLPGAYLDRFAGAADGRVALEDMSKGRVGMRAANAMFCMAASDDPYPVMDGPKDGEAVKLEMPGTELREMLRKVRFAAAKDSTRDVLGGVLMEIEGGKVAMTATDGRRLAHVEMDREDVAAGSPLRVTLPMKLVETLFALLGAESVSIVADAQAVRVVSDGWTLVSKVLAAKYPNWRRVVPESPAHRAAVGREAFLDAMRAAVLALDAGTEKTVSVSLQNGRATFKAKGQNTTGETQSAECEMPPDERVTFHFNPDFLADALGCVDVDDIWIEYDAAEAPVMLKCSLPWLTVIMPQRSR